MAKRQSKNGNWWFKQTPGGGISIGGGGRLGWAAFFTTLVAFYLLVPAIHLAVNNLAYQLFTALVTLLMWAAVVAALVALIIWLAKREGRRSHW